jgi:glucan phosphoethanolaminetransferase (alkaline phosphatase superfamily)
MATDKITGLFFLLLSIYVCIESYGLGLGAFSNPKAGLFPFISGILLGFFSILGFFDKMPLKKAFEDAGNTIRQWKLKKTIYALIVLFAYVLLLKSLGFLLCTFLLVFSIYVVLEPKRLKMGILVAVLSAAVSYFIFQVVIKAQLPRGFLGI